ncbi:MAG: ribonuclease catalytic domain-containing protein [Granulosicoccus sp.]
MSSITPTTSPEQLINDTLESLDIVVAHDKDCLAETQHWLDNPGLDDPALTDWSSLPFVTIDNPDSRDLDQALLIEQTSTGYRVRYALADAAYYIRPETALFKEALRRGTTYYTPSMASPMLPVALSEGLVSLNPLVDRRALVFDMLVNNDGSVRKTTVVRAKICSQAKLNYAGVQDWLDSNAPPVKPYEHSLLLLRELGNKLIDASELRGVVKFDRTETHIKIEGDPAQFKLSVRKRYDTERYNEQISLMCNMQGAEMLLVLQGASNVLQAIFRVHDAPLRKSLNGLRETIDQFSQLHDEPALWRWHKDQSLSEYLDQLPDSERDKRTVRAIQRQVMQAQRGSTYEPEASEHHALKAASYARFSSPMREVVGIFTHKELLEALGADASENHLDEKLRDSVIEAATVARSKQRQLDKKIALAALQQEFSSELLSGKSEPRTGTIMGIRKDRLYVSFDNTALDIKVYKDDLNAVMETDYTLSKAIATPSSDAKPSWRLGDFVALTLLRYDKERARFVFSISHA